LALFGIVLSTVSAQSRVPAAVDLSFSAPAFAVRSRLRGRKKADDSRRRNVAASYARFSSDELQDPKSIGDQQRPCRERAIRDGNQLPTELEFCDEGVSGAKLRRDGFDRMLAAAQAGQFDTLYVFDLSRLARESIINATTLKKLVYKYKVRVVSLTEGIDSNNDNWFTLATILGLQHEQYLKTLGANVLRGLVGNLLNGHSVGDLAYGYGSVPIPRAETQRRGRNERPPKKYVIKENEATWVRKIFDWYVRERQPIRWIVRELNRLNAPRDKRSRGKKWGRSAVINLLRRTKYIGIWEWGVSRNHRDPETGDIYKELRDEEEWQKWVRHLPELKIIDEEVFVEAQRLLDESERKCAEFRGEEGTFTGSPKDRAHPRHLLQRRIRCGECGAYFYVASTRGLACPGARDGVCSCRTMLPRELAEKLILGEIGRRILEDPAWRKAVHEAALREWQTSQSQVPSELQAAQDHIRELDRKIENLLDQVEEGNAPADVKERLRVRRDERAQLARQIEKWERQVTQRPQALTAEQVDEALHSLHRVLSSGTPAASIALGNLIGDVAVRAVSRPGRKRRFLRGEFFLRTGQVADALNGTQLGENEGDAREGLLTGEKIVIDFVEPDPKFEMSDKVKELYDTGMANWEIADNLEIHPSRVTLLYNFWHERRGLPAPEREDRPKRKGRETPLYQRIADEAKRRWEAGDSESEIGRDFQTTQATVRKAIEWWHTSRNLPAPKFADRRKTQVERAGNMYQSGCILEKIADALKVTITTVRKMLDEDFASRGEVRPDGRSRRRCSR
jgi:DNA invertase Pin-like site-specific DNA recombinase